MNDNVLNVMKLEQALRLAHRKAREGFSVEALKVTSDIVKRFPQNKKALDLHKIILLENSKKTPQNSEPSEVIVRPIISFLNQGQLL